MEALNKLLLFIAWIVLLLFAAIFIVNLDSARLLGVHIERFVGKSLDLAYYCLIGMMAFGALTGATWLGIWIVARWNENNRQRDGATAKKQIKVRGHTVLIDMDKMMSAAMVIGPNGIQEIFTTDPQLHLQHAIARARVASMQAAFPGDPAISSVHGSKFRASGMMNAASARLMAGKYDPTQKLLPEPKTIEPDVIPATVRLLPVEEALMQNHRTQLVVGQTDAAEIVRWNMPETPHIRVHGSSQAAGKTNLIRCVATNALRVGHHVIVCDRRRFKDWSEFTDKAEFVDTKNPAAFAQVAHRLQEIYQERDAELGRHGAPNIMRLAQPPQRIVVVVSEFGALCDQAKADGVLDDMLHPLSMVLREAGATGVHVVIEDQFVSDKWPKGLSTNAEPMCGRLPQNYGAAGGYWRADKLPPYTFHYNGTIFRALDMRTVVPQAIATVRPSPPIIDAEYRVVGEHRSSVPAVPGEGSTSGERSQNGAQNGTIGTDEPGRWDDVVAAWFAHNPQALTGEPVGISDLARAMCADNEGNIENYAAYKGRAHKLFHEFRAAVRIPTGKKMVPMGTDISYGG